MSKQNNQPKQNPQPSGPKNPNQGGNNGDKGQANGNPIRGGDRPTKR